MNFLQKITAMEIQPDDRISESDRSYCERHQKAYEAAISSFKELSFFWSDMESVQRELLGEKEYRKYLTSREGPPVSQDLIERHIKALHHSFISDLVRHFNSTYHVSVDLAEVAGTLLPKEPEEHWRAGYKEQCTAYHEQIQSLTVRYQNVVEQVILQLDGRTFTERAFQELYDKCHSAAWNTHKREPKFECRKDTISFIGYFCRFKGWPYNGWELDNGMQDILWGAAHFETGSYGVLPYGFSRLFAHHEMKEPTVEFPACEKVKQMKLFKNNRVDLKFYSPEYAEQFVGKYLGTVG